MSRIEYDFLGGKEIPDDCYYGVQTLRGKENFHVKKCLWLKNRSSSSALPM